MHRRRSGFRHCDALAWLVGYGSAALASHAIDCLHSRKKDAAAFEKPGCSTEISNGAHFDGRHASRRPPPLNSLHVPFGSGA